MSNSRHRARLAAHAPKAAVTGRKALASHLELTPEYAGPVPAKIHATVTLCPKGGLPFRIRALS
jgi:hypothetical protein